MKIDRKATFSSNVTTLEAFAQECLGCDSCTGICRAYIELNALPQAILHKATAQGDKA